jgi:hypothetical protein
MTQEFKELALDGHNYPIWVMDIKISLALCVMYEALLPHVVQLLEPYKYNALYIIRNRIHHDLMLEYVTPGF